MPINDRGINPAIDHGYEHRIGAKLYDYDYNDSVDKEDLVANIRESINSLYTTSLDKQRAACNIKRVGGMMSDFKYDLSANTYYGFSTNSYVLKFPLKNVFWFNSLFVNRINRQTGGYKRKNYTNEVISVPNSAKHRQFFTLSEAYPTPVNLGQGQQKGDTLEHYIEEFRDTNTGSATYGKIIYYLKTTYNPRTDETIVDRYTVRRDTANRVYYEKIRETPKPPTNTSPTIVYTLDDDMTNVDNFHIMFNITDTSNRPDIFTHQLLFFIDGKMYTDIQMYVVPNYVIMVLDADRLSMSLAKISEFTSPYRDYRWTIVGLPLGNYFKTSASGGAISLVEDDIPNNHGRIKLATYTQKVDYYRDGHTTFSYDTIAGTNPPSIIGVHSDFCTTGCSNVQEMPDPNKLNMYLTGYASDSEYIRIGNKPYRQNTGFMKLALTPLKQYMEENTVTTITDDPNGKYKTISTEYGGYINCFNNGDDSYESLGTNNISKFDISEVKDMFIIELKNVASVINLGANRIFQVGCTENIPGPVPPENILIFKQDDADGLSLVHMVSSKYKDTTSETAKYDKKVRLSEKPVEDSIAFKPIEVDSVYDYPKFIPTRDEYNVGEDVHGTFDVTTYTETVDASGYVVSTGETVPTRIDTVRDTQKWIEHYFPNVYKLVGFNPADNLIAVVFYDKNCHIGFDNPLANYMTYDEYYANNVVTGNIPKVIAEYIPDVSKYTEDVYLNTYHIRATRANEYPFKLEALREFVNDDYRRLAKIYDRHYAKQNNKMHANVKYIVDLQHASSEAPIADEFDLRHIYNDQIQVEYMSVKFPYVTRVRYTHNSTYASLSTPGFTLYKLSNGRYVYDAYDLPDDSITQTIVNTGSNVPHGLESPYRYQYASVSNNVVTVETNNLVMNLINDVPQVYAFKISHRTNMKFPATVWVDGVRLDNDYFFITTESFATKINILASAVNNLTKYIEIEIYKMKDINAKETIITLPDIHNSVHLDVSNAYNAWEDISPQHLMVAIEQETIGEHGEEQTRYLVPSSYESYWLLIGHTNYVSGYPTNVNDEERQSVSISTYNVIKSMQGAYYDSEGNRIEKDDVALLADTNTLLIGETDETFNGNVDLLRTFGDEEYYKTLTSDAAKREYVLMLREGYYSRDRRRFYDYLPLGKKDPKVYITPITPFFANKTVKIKNTDVYFNRKFVIEVHAEMDTSRRIVLENFQFDPSPYKYRLFVDGKLLDYDYDYISSVNLEDQNFFMDSDMTLYLRKEYAYSAIHHIVFEYLPYKYQLVHRSAEYDGVITLTDEFIRPFDFRNFDVYLNGTLLTEDDIQVITERRIVITSIADRVKAGETGYHPIVSIYERMHDSDVFDYVWRNHKVAFNYIDLQNPTVTKTRVNPVTGETETYLDDNVQRHPEMPDDFIDVKLAERIKFSLDEQLIRTLPEYRKHRTPSYDAGKSGKEGPHGFQ